MRNQTVAFLQARMSSRRLPGKVMKSVNGQPMIYWQIRRILESKKLDSLVVVTSKDTSDDILVDFLESKTINVFRGSLNNVFSRFIDAAEIYSHDALVRLTADCPLVMPQILDQMIDQFYSLKCDYLSNTLEPSFPDGLDIEILRSGTLKKLDKYKLDQSELEHVTKGIYSRPKEFKISNFPNKHDQSNLRWTVDYEEDIDFVKLIYGAFVGRETIFTYEEVLQYLDDNPGLKEANHGLLQSLMLQKDEIQG